MELIKRLHIIGQQSAQFSQCKDIILLELRQTKTLNGGMLEVGTMDHTQLKPVRGRPFLTQPHIVSCYKMIALKHSW